MNKHLSARVLLVEDDKNLGFLISQALEEAGFEVTLCDNGLKGWDCFNKHLFDLCILDIMMPEKDGFQLAYDIRKNDKNIPVVFLTARSLKVDRMTGYRLGCDDYIVKPFDMDELILKLKAILRRSMHEKSESKELHAGPAVFNEPERCLRFSDKQVSLSSKEAGILRLLFENKNQTVPRSLILKKIWGKDDIFTSNSLDVFLSKIRKHIRQAGGLSLENVHGLGYRLMEL